MYGQPRDTLWRCSSPNAARIPGDREYPAFRGTVASDGEYSTESIAYAAGPMRRPDALRDVGEPASDGWLAALALIYQLFLMYYWSEH